jgi:hypothetical protein
MGSDSTTIHITPSISLPPVLGGIGISAMGTVASGDQRLVVSTWRPERPGWRLPSAALSRFAPSVRDQLPLGYSSATRSARMQQCPPVGMHRRTTTAGSLPGSREGWQNIPLSARPLFGASGSGRGTAQGRSRLRHRGRLGRPNHDLQSLQRRSTLEVLICRGPCRPGGTSQRWCKAPTHGSGGRPGRLCRIASGLSGLCQRQLNDNPPLLPLVVGVHAGERAAEQLAGRRVQYESKVAGTASSRRPVLLYT